MSTQDPEKGLVVGNEIDYQAVFTGVVGVTGQGKPFHVRKASLTAGFDGQVSPSSAADATHWEQARSCDVQKYWKECIQDIGFRVTPREPKVNLGLNLGIALTYKLPGYVCYAGCLRRDYETYQDTIYGDKKDIYYDIFPADIDGFAAWTELTDNDRDGDGLPNGQDPYPDNPDYDGDGLTDAVEREIGTALDKSDTDGDGLSDYQELIWGTDPKKSDTDEDGLLDGEELEGWEVDFHGYYPNFWVISSPTNSDVDWDGVLDGQEKAQQTNPYAATFALGGSADWEPRIEDPGSVVTDTVWVFNPTSVPAHNLRITTTLPAEIPAPSLVISGDISLSTVSDQCVGAAPSGPCIWQAGELPAGDQVLIYLIGTIDPAITQSHWATGTMTATAVMTDAMGELRNLQVSAQPRLGIDSEPPTSAVDWPDPAGFIGGITLTVAGRAQDEISWVERVDVRLTGITSPTYDTDWQEAEGLEGWSYGWAIGPDGDYGVQSRATDPFDHVETPSPAITFTVDNTPPTSTIVYPQSGEMLNPPLLPDGRRVFTVTGTADDRSAAPRVSGVEGVYLGVDYIRPSDTAVAMLPASLAASGQPTTSWQYGWTLPDIRPDRLYILTAQAVDGVGNVGDTDTITVAVDTTAPSVFFDEQPDVIGTSPVTISGLVWDVPPTFGSRPGLWLRDFSFSQADLSTGWSEDSRIAVSPAGDTNGDGYDDFLFLASGPIDDKLYLVLGRHETEWPSQAQALSLFGQAATVIAAGLGKIQAAAAIGDFNDDGYDDFAVAVYKTDTFSDVYLIPGRPETQWQASMTPQEASTTSLSSGTTYSIRPAGNTNGDGYDDFLIKSSSVAQPVLLVLGQVTWSTAPDSVIFGGNAIERADASGDLNGDGLTDVAVAGGTSPSGVYVFFGRADWGTGGFSLSDADVTFSGQNVFDSRMLGDVNGDGYGDLAALDVQFGGTIYVIPGGESMSSDTLENAALASFTNLPVGDADPAFPWMGALGDVNADGLADFALGTQGYDSPPTGAWAYLIFGTRSGWATGENVKTSDLVAASYEQSRAYELWHSAVHQMEWAGLGDLDGDGFDDFGFTMSHTDEEPSFGIPGSRSLRLYFGRRGAYIPTAGVDWVRVGLHDRQTGVSDWYTATMESPGAIFSSWAITWTPPLTGTFDLLGQAADRVGNVSDIFTSTQTLVVDRIAPTVDVVYPANGATLYDPVVDIVLEVSEGEFGSGVEWVGVRISETMGMTQTITATLRNDGKWFARWWAQGWQKDILGLARDGGGNTGQSNLINVTTEMATSSSLTSPVPYQAVSGVQFIVEGWARTDGVWPLSGVEVRQDGTRLGDATPSDFWWDTESAWVYTWTLPTDGQYVLTSWASDFNGYTQTTSTPVTVTVDNTPPVITLTHPTSGTHVILNLSSDAYTITGQITDTVSGVSAVSVRTADDASWEVYDVGNLDDDSPFAIRHSQFAIRNSSTPGRCPLRTTSPTPSL